MEDLTRLSRLFVDEYGKPIILSGGQSQIYNAIVRKEPKRNIVITATQYGKSLTCSLGVLSRATIFPEKWAIISSSEKKARIIMGYVISHIFDNKIFESQLLIDTPLERLKRERSKNRLTFRRKGEIFILSADSKNKRRTGEALLGFGAQNIVLDESSVIDDDIYAMVKRMLGGHKDNFMLEIGNPFKNNHFRKTWEGKFYNKIFIDYKQALAEGRFTQEFIEEMRSEDFFDVLYECKFPDRDAMDSENWTPLISSNVLESKINRDIPMKGVKRMGVDVSRGGGNYNVYVIRTENHCYVKDKDQLSNLVDVADKVVSIAKEENIHAENIFVDDNGVGGGVTDTLRKANFQIVAVKAQNIANDSRFYNVRAELYWRIREWIAGDVSIRNTDDLMQLLDIKYKVDERSGKLRLMSKIDMKRKGIDSPDFADAMSLTMFRREIREKPEAEISLIRNSTTGYPTGEYDGDKMDLRTRLGIISFPDYHKNG